MEKYEKPVAEGVIKIEDTTGNPAPIGLIAFGMTTVLLNLHNAGFIALGTMILSMGIFYGGIAQVIAGILEWKKNNTFGATAFISYGMFWLSLVGLIVLAKIGWGEASDGITMASYLFVWGIFTAIMFIGTLKLNKALQFVFGSLTLLFFLLAFGDATNNVMIKKIAGYEGILCGISALYTGLAQVLNEVHGRILVPIWPVK
jgi:succinate-acetate transporter protein